MTKSIVKIYGLIGSILLLITFIISFPFSVFNTISYLNPTMFMNSFYRHQVESYEKWKEHYLSSDSNSKAFSEETKKRIKYIQSLSDDELKKRHAIFVNETISEEKHIIVKSLIISLVFLLICIILFPIHYRLFKNSNE